MKPTDTPTQLFDHALSGGSAESWNRRVNQQIGGCEVIVANAGTELGAMVEQFNPTESNWYVLLIEIPGFKGSEWVGKTETLQSIVQPLAPSDTRTWVYILGGMDIGVLVRIPTKPELVAFVQKLNAALALAQGSPRTRMAEVPAQKQVVKDYLAAQKEKSEEWKRQQQAAEAARRIASISFDMQEGIVARRATRNRPLLMLVDDDAVTVQLLEHLISQLKMVDIITARNAEEAALMYRRNAPDMVLLDIGLPEVDGLTLLGKLKEADPAAYVVMLTANAYRSNLEKASQLGAKGFLAKPFTPAKITQVVTQIVNRKEKQ